ncbi:glycosyl hydrolase family 18 protein [Paenibacillus sp. HB172176]|uniref:glycosyl hydrolase family 18 protein n=1 Tax=Paenibacillus sp. HB172176 TaxID=2493690 RepID=UPI001438BE20|nr:glycosyl hydrolase family 18 protein [Paenibacillus sp. HB172176]
MVKKLGLIAAFIMLLHASLAPGMHRTEAAAASAQMTEYRVYQYDQALKEFASEGAALNYAKYFSYSHVERIADRKWLWNNFPKYKVYQNGRSTTKMEFADYNAALAYAKTLANASIRDLENIGWTYESYDRYRLYQGDNTLSKWSFRSLEEAKKEAKKWSNAHIVDLNTMTWIWDNLTASQIKDQRSANAVYQLQFDNAPIVGAKMYAYLKEAIEASNDYEGSQVVNVANGKIVHSNEQTYEVLQNGKLLKTFIGMDEAVKMAKKYANSEVKRNGSVLWTSVPYLKIYQSGRLVNTFHELGSALQYAKYYANITIRTDDGRALWTNVKPLQILGWNGSGSSSVIASHVANTQGLNYDSPTWFELKGSDGAIGDTSDASVVKQLKDKGILVTPLVHNGFNRALTSAFLSDLKAQDLFILQLVSKLAALGVHGVNLDFEEVAGADRDAYTAFVKRLADAAHAKQLKVSIDLPRGSVSWNHLTAYDHAALAGIVDTVIIMAYDEHWKGSEEPGSVASLSWAEEGVKQFLNYGVPRSKLMLGIPFYVREWRLATDGTLIDNKAILMKSIPQLIKDTGAVGEFDIASGQWKYTYVQDGYTHLFWAETPDTVLARVAIAKKYDLAGIAAWRLGYEDGELWTQLLRAR